MYIDFVVEKTLVLICVHLLAKKINRERCNELKLSSENKRAKKKIIFVLHTHKMILRLRRLTPYRIQ